MIATFHRKHFERSRYPRHRPTEITELLEALAPQIGSAPGRGGERPVLCSRHSASAAFANCADIRPEAIQRVEILPEESRAKYGYRADQRVGLHTPRALPLDRGPRRGQDKRPKALCRGLGDATRLIIGSEGRTSINLRARGNSASPSRARHCIEPIEGNPSSIPRDDPHIDRIAPAAARRRTHIARSRQRPASINGELEHSEGRSLTRVPDARRWNAAARRTQPAHTARR